MPEPGPLVAIERQSGSVSDICLSGEASNAFSIAASRFTSSSSVASFSLSRVLVSSTASDGSSPAAVRRSAVSSFLVYMLSPLPRHSGWAYSSLCFTQPYQPSPKGLSGRPAHCPFRGLLGVYSRYGLHTRAEDHLAGLRDLGGSGAKVSSESPNHFDHKEAKMMYSGIDLHSNNSVVAIIDDADRVVAQKRLPNDITKIVGFLARWQGELAGVVVESTYNWYWLIDGLQDAGLHGPLPNTAAIKQYDGLKHSGDVTDAQHLAHLLRLGILPTGTILPREHRAVRDLARKRMQMVHCCTSQVLAVENIMARQLGERMTSNQIKRLTNDEIDKMPLTADVGLAMKSNIAVIATLQSQI